jgi:predicted DCC family thiol-disulfide oxidoreductase YuxK
MAENLRVAHPPERPLAIFDGDCGFCRLWIARWRARTGSKVDYAPSQEVGGRFPEISPERYARALQLVLPDGVVLEAAEAVFALAGREPGAGLPLMVYRRLPGIAPLCELAYRIVASHRSAAMAVTRIVWGRSVEKPTYYAATSLFLRLLGVCYFAAFVSLWVQVSGLVGSHGILPLGPYLDWVRAQTGAERFWLLPTLCWLDPGDAFLHLLCGGGALSALAVIMGFVPAAALAVCWLFYLSLSVAGQVFLQFQWDLLLLETGLIAILVASPRRLRFGAGLAASAAPLVLLRWLLFRLMISSGWVKLASHDPTWRDLTALRYHYQTQPLPPWTAWYMQQLPAWFQTASVLFLFFVELVIPFLFFAPKRLRRLACGLTVLLQLLIAATGNYAFFNLLAIALALLLLDDGAFPRRWRDRAVAAASRGGHRSWPRGILLPASVLLFFVSSVEFAATLSRSSSLPGPAVAVARWMSPFRSTNNYGLFAVMTTSRPEIVVEGSDDAKTWKPYEFRWKPGDVRRRPRFVAPHQPRLDWQMWFAALGSYRENPWFVEFLGRLLEGSPEVTGLLARDPFPGAPPRYVRAVLYDYRFTDFAQRRATGAWWLREPAGLYCPVLSRR